MNIAHITLSLVFLGGLITGCGIKGKPLPPLMATPQLAADPEPEVVEAPKIDPAAGKKQDSKTKKKKRPNGN